MLDIYHYEGNGENSDRFVLGHKGHGKNLLALCVNPSTATAEHYDATMTKLAGFAERNDFDGFTMINLYSQRSTRLSNLEMSFNRTRHAKNIEAIGRIVNELQYDAVWAAWGNSIGCREYLRECLRDIYAVLDSRGLDWKCAGLTKHGNPRHPSRVAYGEFQPFDIESYLCNMQ